MDTMTESTLVKVLIGLNKEHISAIDEWRRHQQDLPSRSESIRRILDEHLLKRAPKSKAAGKRKS
jgi:metal-responsive CopG/Arc/MetJ family transcriptional regulator